MLWFSDVVLEQGPVEESIELSMSSESLVLVDVQSLWNADLWSGCGEFGSREHLELIDFLGGAVVVLIVLVTVAFSS